MIQSQSLQLLPSRNTQPTPTTKMKSFIVFALLVAAAVALPLEVQPEQDYESKSDNIGVGPYSYEYRAIDKAAQETAQWKNLGADGQALEVRGQFSYTDKDGVVYTVTYIADENGYRAEGAHLPKN